MLRKGFLAAITVALIATIPASVNAADLTATLEIPVSGLDPAWDQTVCVWGERPEWGRPSHFDRCVKPVDHRLTIDGLKPGKVRLFLFSKGEHFGAQWLGEAGGTGEVEAAVVMELKAGATTEAPKALIDPPHQITGFIYGGATPKNIVGACASVAPTISWAGGCVWREDYAFSIRMLGPYKWPIYFTAPGYAGQWHGGSPERNGSVLLPLPHPTSISEFLRPEGTVALGIPCCTDGQRIEAFNATTGDLIASTGDYPELTGLNNSRFVLRQTSADGSVCWFKMYPPRVRFGLPYFSATAGRKTVLSGLKCQGEEPMLLTQPTVPGRRPPLTRA